MKKILLIILFPLNLFATNYYVDATGGNDASAGTSTGTAWKTLAKVNSFTFGSNDYILLKRGEVFYGSVIVKRSNLNFGAYGSGAKPIITGLSTVSGWVNLGGNIWEAPVINVKAAVNLVTKDNVMQAVGRYPNSNAANGGYISATSSTLSSVTTSMLSTTTNWTGAELVIRADRWDIKKTPVIAHSGGTMSFSAFGKAPKVGFGVFIQRDSRTLDINGEWYYNNSTSKLRMYFSDNNPSGHDIRIATVDTLLVCPQSNILVRDIKFYGSGKFGMRFIGGSNISIKSCEFENSGDEAILCKSQTSNVLIDSCIAINNLGSGIRITSSGTGLFNGSITNSIVDKTALLVGMLPSLEESNPCNGIQLSIVQADSLRLIGNSVTNSGYCGISWSGDSAMIRNNYVDSFCSTLDDGGAIYTVENKGGTSPNIRHNRYVIGNIVGNGIGALAGTTGSFNSGVVGFYSDLGSGYIVYDGNTAFNIKGNGFHGNNNKNITMYRNTIYNCTQSFSTQRFNDGDIVRNMDFKYNTISNYRTQYINQAINLPTLLTVAQDLQAIGVWDYNYYSTKTGTDTSITIFARWADNTNTVSSSQNFSYLKVTALQETHSTNFANNGRFYYNETDTVRQVKFIDSIFSEPNGKLDTSAVNIQPDSSKILVFVGTVVAPAIPPIPNAGNDTTIQLPSTSAQLNGSGIDGTHPITTKSWAFISGPTTPTISNTAIYNPVVSNMTVAGTYIYWLTVSDGYTSPQYSQVSVTVIPATVIPTPTFSSFFLTNNVFIQ